MVFSRLSQGCRLIPIPSPAAVPAPIGDARIGQATSSPRPPADTTLAAPQGSTACHLRPGLHPTDLVRASGAGPHRLQSAPTGSPLLSSLGLLRGPDARLLARGTAPWRRAHRSRNRRLAGGLLRQNACCGASNQGPRRCGFLRSQGDCGHRGSAREVRYRRQADASLQSAAPGFGLYRGVAGAGSRRMFLPASPVAPPLPLCGGSQEPARRRRGTDHVVHTGPLHLSRFRHQPSSSTSLGLSLLQRSGGGRTHHPGAESRLPLGQDSHSSVRRQRSLLPSFALCLQSHELVQTPLLARGVSLDHSGDVTSPARDDPRAVRSDPSGTNTQNSVLALGARSYYVCSYLYRPTQNLTFFTQDSG